MNRRTSIGLTVGGGIEFRAGPLRLSPGVRLTRWDTERTSSLSSGSRLARTQADVLLGIGYVASDDPHTEAMRPRCCVEVGVLAGVPLLPASHLQPARNAFPTFYDAPTRRFTGGAFLECRFHPRLSIEGSFLVRRFGFTETVDFGASVSRQAVSGYSWEGPVLGKWRAVRVGRGALWLGAGPALRRASSVNYLAGTVGQEFRIDGSFLSRSAMGVAAAGGLEWLTGVVRLRPEIRYSWFERPLYDFSWVRARQESLHILIGISWTRR